MLNKSSDISICGCLHRPCTRCNSTW